MNPRCGSHRLGGPGTDPAVGLVAGFAADAYRFTVSRSTPNSRATRRWDQPRCVNAMIVGVMGANFVAATRAAAPQAAIVHDRFHVSQHLNDAVDKTRVR